MLDKGQDITSEAQLAVTFGQRVVVGALLVAAEPVQHGPDAVIGALGDGKEEDDDEEDDFSEGGYTMEEVAKHNKKGDVLNGRVLNVPTSCHSILARELAILTFAGKDATAEFDMIHPPGVVEKYTPDAIIGVARSCKAKKAKGSAKSTLPVATDTR